MLLYTVSNRDNGTMYSGLDEKAAHAKMSIGGKIETMEIWHYLDWITVAPCYPECLYHPDTCRWYVGFTRVATDFCGKTTRTPLQERTFATERDAMVWAITIVQEEAKRLYGMLKPIAEQRVEHWTEIGECKGIDDIIANLAKCLKIEFWKFTVDLI